MTAHTNMTKSQRARINRVIRRYRASNRHNHVTSVRVTVEPCGPYISLTVNTRRSDCDKYSPRQIFCSEYLHAFVGPRGGLDIKTARSGLNKASKRHITFMTRN